MDLKEEIHLSTSVVLSFATLKCITSQKWNRPGHGDKEFDSWKLSCIKPGAPVKTHFAERLSDSSKNRASLYDNVFARLIFTSICLLLRKTSILQSDVQLKLN